MRRAGCTKSPHERLRERGKERVAHETRERHVPPRPEFLEIPRPERTIEVLLHADADQTGGSDSHVAVAAEIQVEIEEEGDRRDGQIDPWVRVAVHQQAGIREL